METAPRIRVLIVDDQLLFRQGLVRLLEADPAISIVGQAEDGHEAVTRAAALLPDVVVMDVLMPRLDGIAATEQIVTRHPSIRVLMLSAAASDETIVDSLRAGAIGYVTKHMSREALIEAIHTAYEGRHVLSHESQLAAISAALGKNEVVPPPEGLTARQFEILKLMSLGLALKQIGRELGVAEKTIRNQASLMYRKLRVEDRAQAILYAFRKGLVA